MMKKTKEILAHSHLFGGLPEKDREEIARIAVGRSFSKGQTIFLEGDEGNGFYLIGEGTVSVYKTSPEGKEQILHILTEGETVGVVPVFSGRSFPASARALSDSYLLFFDRHAFVQLLTGKQELVMNLLALLSARLREFTVQVENLSFREIPGRIAFYLLHLAREQGSERSVRLNISKGQLAKLLGTGPESLSRALGNMKSRGLIAEEGHTIRFLDREALEELASK